MNKATRKVRHCSMLSGSLPTIFLPCPPPQCDAMETHSGENVFNSAEAQLVSKTIDILIEGGVPSGDIGVITPYRQQQKIIRERLKEKPPERQNTVSTSGSYGM